MDDAMRAHFREKGWLVVKDALSADVIAAANAIYDTFLDGTAERMHPEDSGWDGEEFTHYWYNTGQVRPEEERHGRPRILWGQPYYDMLDRARPQPARPHPPHLC